MITTTYQCDKCARTQNAPDGFGYVDIGWRSIGTTNPQWATHKLLLCRQCLVDTHLVGSTAERAACTVKAPTPVELLTDLIRHIVQEEIGNNT